MKEVENFLLFNYYYIMFNSDNISKEDKLDREPFAKEIAHNLVHSFKNGEPSLAIGIVGKWGCGKSTLMEYIKNHLREAHKQKADTNYVIFDFNPWMFSGQKELQSIFLNQLTKKVSYVNENIRKFFEEFSEAINIFSFVKYIHPLAGQVIDSAKSISKELSKQPSLEKLKEQIDTEIVRSGLKLYIFIDDLDRLSPDEIAEILKLVKLNASFKNTFYLLAYDKDYVVKSLEKNYGTVEGNYLEKIIQVDYAVPEIRQEKIENVFFQKLGEFIKRHNLPISETEVFSIWEGNGFKKVFKTIRDVNRYFNALQLRLPIVFKEVNVIDFMLVEALRLFDYPLYSELLKQITSKSYNLIIDRKHFFEGLDKSSPGYGTCEYLIKDSDKYFITNRTDRRFIDPAFTSRYLALGISSSDVSEVELQKFLTNPNERQAVLTAISTFGRTENFLRRISNPLLNKQFPIHDYFIFKSILDFWDDSERALEYDKYCDTITDAIFNLIEISNDPSKAFDEFTDEIAIYSLRFSITTFAIQDYIVNHFGVRHNKGFHEKVKAIVNKKKEVIRTTYIKNMEGWVTTFINNPARHFLNGYPMLKERFIFRYSQILPDKYLPIIKGLIQSEYPDNYKNIIAIMKCVIGCDSTTKRPFIVRDQDELIPKEIRNEFIYRVKEIDEQLLDARDKQLRDFFLGVFVQPSAQSSLPSSSSVQPILG